jgi:hypothetical protein
MLGSNQSGTLFQLLLVDILGRLAGRVSALISQNLLNAGQSFPVAVSPAS